MLKITSKQADKIGTLPEIITKDAEAAIKAADEAYNALTEYEKTLVDSNARKKLEDAKSALAALNKPSVNYSPQTGDHTNLWMWFALLLVSSSGLIGTSLYSKKRKETEEH